MKNIFGVEYYSKQEDFDIAIEKVKALLKDGDESEIVYIASDNEETHAILVRGSFKIKQGQLKFTPVIEANFDLIKALGIVYETSNKYLLTS
jgi:predicted RNA-binding protein with PIN domain